MNNPSSTIILLIGIIAMAGDFIIPTILSRRYPGYNPLYDVISELGSSDSPVRIQLSAWLVILGILLTLFGVGQASRFENFTWAHSLYITGILGFGIGAGIIAGIFPEDSHGAVETASGKIHGIFGGLGFLLLLLNPLWALKIDEFNGLETLNLILFILGAVSFGLFLASKRRNTGLLGMSGLWQRLYLFFVYGALLMNYLQ
jgi:hypothetical membrane protein